MKTELEDKARRGGITLSGSVIAVPGHRREHLVERLLSAGHWVHADMITGSYLGQEGTQPDEIARLAAIAGPRLDAHLMVDNPTEVIGQLPNGIGRITIQFPRQASLEDAVELARPKADSVWIALDNPSPAELQRALQCIPDGLLAMLTPPGMPGHSADLERLARIQASHVALPPLGVDGGVNETNLDLLREAGVTYAVAGRALAAGLCTSVRPSPVTHRK